MTYAEATESTWGESCPALLEAAHPEMYRRNAFRVLGLPVEATPREISRHAERLQMMRKYNAKVPPKTSLALDPPPDEHAVREVVHKLHDPEKRLIDELFWFWPHQLGESKNDQALLLLAEGAIDRAAEHWRQMEQSNEAYVSMHNLAVLHHCLALDLEQAALSRKLEQRELETLHKYWSQASKRWKVVFDHEPFWSRLTARIRALEDPRLTTGLARRIRACLPLALLSINAALAVRYAELGNLEAAKRQLQIIREWDVSGAKDRTHGALGPLAEKVVREACEPLRQRIKSICKNANEQADKDPIRGDKATRELLIHTKPLLAIFDTLLPPEDTMRGAAHDEVAVCALRCQIPYGNKTKDWKICLELLELVLPIAVGQAVRDRIQENIDTVKGNLEYSTCWFCKKNYKDDEEAVSVEMFGDVKRTPTELGKQITWRHRTVKVPRCTRCRRAHNHEENWSTVGCLLGIILGIGGCLVAASSESALAAILAFVVLGLFGIGIGVMTGKALRPKEVKPESAKKKFPDVKKLLDLGWKFGEGPLNTR